MGSSFIKATFRDIAGLVHKWAQSHSLSITKDSPTTPDKKHIGPSGHITLRAKSAFYEAAWQCQLGDTGCTVSMKLKPRLHLVFIIHVILFVGLWYLVSIMQDILKDYTMLKFAKLSLCAIFVMLIIWWKDNKLSLKLTQLENSFWDMAKGRYDTGQRTRAQGQLCSKKLRLSTELLFLGFLIYIGVILLGALGGLIALLLCFPFLFMIIAELIQEDNPHWHWRFWIMGNMARWTFLMLSVVAVALVLLSLEVFQNLGLYNLPNPPPVKQAIKQASFRKISPATATMLETDAKKRLYELADAETLKSKIKIDEERTKMKTTLVYINGWILMVVIIVTISFFVIRPLIDLLKSQKVWKHEVSKREGQQGPFVPYLPEAWKWKTPLMLRVLVLFHYVFGGIINLAAAVFCFEGLSYAFAGQTFMIEKSANLWSWIFATSKIIFGEVFGQMVGAVLVLIICIPILMLLGTFVRRSIRYIFLMVRIVYNRASGSGYENDKTSFIEHYVKDVCSGAGINSPTIIFTTSKNIVMRLHWLPLNRKAVIEISQGTAELLDLEELRASVAHELGHIKQGLWKVGILKLFSSLMLFPNYYLTLCLDWSRKEMEADQYALTLAHDSQSLKRALVKMSTAQVSYLNTFKIGHRSYLSKNKDIRSIKGKWHSICVSARFFFGDSLFGYAHPYLSERLAVIGTNEKQCLENHRKSENASL